MIGRSPTGNPPDISSVTQPVTLGSSVRRVVFPCGAGKCTNMTVTLGRAPPRWSDLDRPWWKYSSSLTYVQGLPTLIWSSPQNCELPGFFPVPVLQWVLFCGKEACPAESTPDPVRARHDLPNQRFESGHRDWRLLCPLSPALRFPVPILPGRPHNVVRGQCSPPGACQAGGGWSTSTWKSLFSSNPYHPGQGILFEGIDRRDASDVALPLNRVST